MLSDAPKPATQSAEPTDLCPKLNESVETSQLLPLNFKLTVGTALQGTIVEFRRIDVTFGDTDQCKVQGPNQKRLYFRQSCRRKP